MSTVAMNELWAYLKSLSLSAGNKAWIESLRADKLAETDEFACFSGIWGDDMPVNEYAESLRSAHVDEAYRDGSVGDGGLWDD